MIKTDGLAEGKSSRISREGAKQGTRQEMYYNREESTPRGGKGVTEKRSLLVEVKMKSNARGADRGKNE